MLKTLSAFIILFCASFPLHSAEDLLDQAILDEQMRQSGGGNDSDVDLSKRVRATLKTIPLILPKEYRKSTEKFPASASNVSIDNKGNFIRNGKPVFLMGVEAEMYNGDWLHRILGIDFSQITSIPQGEFRGAGEVKKNGKTITISHNKKSPWMDLRFKESLRGGTLVTYDNYLGMSNFWPLPWRKYDFQPPVYTSHTWRKPSSHFFDLNMENPEAYQLYANSNAWLAQHARKFPVFAVEMINEVSYINQSVENLKGFQQDMKKKYGSIKKANESWRTDFSSFNKVFPPLNVQSAMIYNSQWGMSPYGKAFKQHLWLDWSKWSDLRAGEVFKSLANKIKDDYADATITVQSPYLFGQRAITPAVKAGSEDVFGTEAFLRIFRQSPGDEDWGTMTASLHFQYEMDIVRCETNIPIINWEAGIKGYPYSKNDYNAKNNYVIGTAGMRLFFWHQMIHGGGGSVISYFYGGEQSNSGLSVWDPRKMSFDAIKALPSINNEINSLSSIVLPRPRIKGQVGFLATFENTRGALPEGIHKKTHPEILDYYAAATFSKVDVDLLTSEKILKEKHIPYSLLIGSRAQRINPQALERIKSYVKNGGNILLSPACFQIDDDMNSEINLDNFIGGTRGKILSEIQSISYAGKTWKSQRIDSIATDIVNSGYSPMHGFNFTPSTAQVLIKSDNGPALTVNTYGKGKVYYIAVEPEPILRQKFVNKVIDDVGIQRSVQFTFTDAISTDRDYVESHSFSMNNKHVQYFVNFGGKRTATFIPNYSISATNTIRNVSTQQYMQKDGSYGDTATTWTQADIQKGIPVTLEQHDPMVLLIEEANEAALPLKSLSAEQKEVLTWLYRPSPPSDKRVLIDSVHQYEGRVHKYRMPTAVKTLEDRGYEVNSLANPFHKPLMRSSKGVLAESLSDYNVYVLPSPNPGEMDKKSRDLILEYVKNGGGLLYCVATEFKNPGKSHPLLEALGVNTRRSNFYDTNPAMQTLNEELYVKFKNPVQHPITNGVKEFHSAGAKPLYIINKSNNPISLFSGSQTSHTLHPWGDTRRGPGQAVIVALSYGKGRVVVVGADSWLRPDNLKWGDNQKLFDNMVDWLAAPSKDTVKNKQANKRNNKDKAPNMVREKVLDWDFENKNIAFAIGSYVSGTAQSGKQSVQAATVEGKWFDCGITTRWNKAGYCTVPKKATLNFSYKISGMADGMVIIESGNTRCRLAIDGMSTGGWQKMSIPFDSGDNTLRPGSKVMNIVFKVGETGDGLTFQIDDLSITK